MTDFMKILLDFTCVGDQRAEGAQFQSTCKLCRESHKTQNSDAELYAPAIGNRTNCKLMILRCYILELRMVTMEEAVPDEQDCVIRFIKAPLTDLTPDDGCPKCEDTSTLSNITTFLDRLNNLLEEIIASHSHQNKSADT